MTSKAKVCGAIFAAPIIYDSDDIASSLPLHRRSRCPEFPRNVSSMTTGVVFSRQMQTILV
jgi:hypothetical protein